MPQYGEGVPRAGKPLRGPVPWVHRPPGSLAEGRPSAWGARLGRGDLIHVTGRQILCLGGGCSLRLSHLFSLPCEKLRSTATRQAPHSVTVFLHSGVHQEMRD